jgi:hypothetical protein
MPAYAIVRPQVLAGKVKVLAVTNHERAPALPDVPTATEAGYPSLEFDGLVGLFGPPEMAPDVRAKIAGGHQGGRLRSGHRAEADRHRADRQPRRWRRIRRLDRAAAGAGCGGGEVVRQ